MQLVAKSGVTTAWFHWMGTGRSTRMPRPSRTAAKWSSCSFARSTVSSGRGPHCPRMGLSSGILASVAGSVGGMQVWSARPRMMWRRGSKSFHELTMVWLIASLLSRSSARTGARPGAVRAERRTPAEHHAGFVACVGPIPVSRPAGEPDEPKHERSPSNFVNNRPGERPNRIQRSGTAPPPGSQAGSRAWHPPPTWRPWREGGRRSRW